MKFPRPSPRAAGPTHFEIPALLRYSLIGLGIVAVVVAAAMFINRGSQVRLEGKVIKTRTVATDDNSSILIAEVRIKNPARIPFWVKEVRTSLVDGKGEEIEGMTVAEPDLDRVLDYYKDTGPRYNPVLKAREKIAGGQAMDRTVSASFQVAANKLAASAFVIRVQDADGAVTEFRGGPAPGR